MRILSTRRVVIAHGRGEKERKGGMISTNASNEIIPTRKVVSAYVCRTTIRVVTTRITK